MSRSEKSVCSRCTLSKELMVEVKFRLVLASAFEIHVGGDGGVTDGGGGSWEYFGGSERGGTVERACSYVGGGSSGFRSGCTPPSIAGLKVGIVSSRITYGG